MNVVDAIKGIPVVSEKKRIGRPLGAKTRADAPSRLRRLGLNPSSPEISQLPPKTNLNGSRPDTDLFGASTVPPENAHSPETELPPDDTQLPPENENDESSTHKNNSQPEDHRAFSTMIFDSVTNLMAVLIGTFWLPRKKGDDAEKGEIPFDEKEMVVSAMCKYFAFVGMAMLTPLQELYMAIFAYSAPRLNLTIQWIKFKFMKKAKPAQTPPPDTRMPETPKTETPPKTDKPQSSDESNIGLDAMAAEVKAA